ncbi:H(+)/Cl(-) exchange transporter 7-like isoform X3 [Littorina saxatilis]|uniref:H(+)/Cl(-) exchange transporter 7-like isoform X3 n=1 Tax=Littorina saxatilis TaxID=31220 RepID=UPI0038B5C324
MADELTITDETSLTKSTITPEEETQSTTEGVHVPTLPASEENPNHLENGWGDGEIEGEVQTPPGELWNSVKNKNDRQKSSDDSEVTEKLLNSAEKGIKTRESKKTTSNAEEREKLLKTVENDVDGETTKTNNDNEEAEAKKLVNSLSEKSGKETVNTSNGTKAIGKLFIPGEHARCDHRRTSDDATRNKVVKKKLLDTLNLGVEGRVAGDEVDWQHYLTHPAHGFSRDGVRRVSQHVNIPRREHVRFTVTPVRQTSINSGGGSGRKHLAVFEVGEDGDVTDTLTQNSITSLLSAKFRDLSKRWKQYGEESPRFRKRLVSKWESMNYDQIDSQLFQEENNKLKNKSKKKLAVMWVSRWFMMFLVGIGTSLLAAGVHIAVELVAHQKFHLIAKYLDKCSDTGCLMTPVAIWCGINLGISLLAAALVTYVQPTAAGSGIPLIKSYLNGVRVPGLLSLRCFIAKTVGVVLSILGGLACGKEGPMAHSGGIMAAGLGKGRIPWFGRDFKLYNAFRTDHEVRDFVAAGAASGVSAAFGAPVGGTLFSVEEAASFWNTELVWRVFFSAMIACFSTNFLLSAFEGHPTELSHPGLVRFNTFPNLTFDLIEIPVFILMAVIGGLTGALFVVLNYKLTVFRQKYLHRHNWIKVAEAGLVSVVSAVAGFLLMFGVRECTTAKPNSSHAITTSMFCEEGSFNTMSTMFLTTPEGCLKSLLHDPLESYGVLPLVAFIVIFFLLGVWTYGLSVSSGVFIPSLAIGAAWGRLVGMGVVQLFPDQLYLDAKAKDVGKYALIGAASQLGGILRTTISLTVIIVECTGDISFGLCIMITLMISKWVGDFFTTGLYDMNVEVSGIPLLSWEPPPLSDNVRVSEFMSHPVLLLMPREKVGHILDILQNETFHGFPIIEQDPSSVLQYKGKLRGIVLRDQLLTLLQKKAFAPEGMKTSVKVSTQEFNDPYPVSQRVSIKDLEITEDEKHCVLDFKPYMNRTPYTVNPDFSMPRVFRLFRGLGLRHLVVIDEDYQPIGMVTRKDLAKYRAGTKRGMLHMEQLTIENV